MFLRTRVHPTDVIDGELYLSCLFFGLVHLLFNGFTELPLMIFRLPVFYKQRDNCFYPAWAWSISSWILRVPYSAVEAIVWSCVVYYTVGFAPGAGRCLHCPGVYLSNHFLLAYSTHLLLVNVSGFFGTCFCCSPFTKWHLASSDQLLLSLEIWSLQIHLPPLDCS